MYTSEKLKADYNKISMFFATIYIAPILVVLLIPVVAQSSLILHSASLDTFPGSTYYLTAYLVIPIVYCIIASLLFHPKRFVSPLNLQILTIVLFVSYMICIAFTTGLTLESLNSLISDIFILLIIAVMFGYFQFLIVRWVIGLNFNSIDSTSFIINEKMNTIMKLLDGKFIKSWSLSREKDNPNSKKNNLDYEI